MLSYSIAEFLVGKLLQTKCAIEVCNGVRSSMGDGICPRRKAVVVEEEVGSAKEE